CKEVTPPRDLRTGVDPRVEAICLRMMAKKVVDRFPSMKAVADELAAIVKSPLPVPPTTNDAPTLSRKAAALDRMSDGDDEKALTESDLSSLEKLVRKCLRRRDYDQAVQIVERIPEHRRSEGIQSLLVEARKKADLVAFLICEIDEADRLTDAKTAIAKAE